MNSLTPTLCNIPCCIIHDENHIECNPAFFEEFDDTSIITSISHNTLVSTISYRDNLYSVYKIERDSYVFFKKDNILKYVLSHVPNLELIDIKAVPQIYEENIDKQHIKITIIINSIIRATKVDTNYNELILMLYELQGAIKEHFEYENQILDVNDITTEEHINQHKTLLENYSYLILNLTGENLTYIISYLPEWFMKHIIEYDVKSKYLTTSKSVIH